jgi:hypothetical protein
MALFLGNRTAFRRITKSGLSKEIILDFQGQVVQRIPLVLSFTEGAINEESIAIERLANFLQ